MAKKLEPLFGVVLRSGIPAAEYHLLAKAAATKLTTPEGLELLAFACTQVDFSHPVLIEMHTFRKGDQEAHILHIPMQYVLLISEWDKSRQIGFVDASG